ncbi:MAG: hypothetical protein H6556_28340 [Lewinellaceae bacterium]|nr:hypothetical protein [Lewinellaceae bacterium]
MKSMKSWEMTSRIIVCLFVLSCLGCPNQGVYFHCEDIISNSAQTSNRLLLHLGDLKRRDQNGCAFKLMSSFFTFNDSWEVYFSGSECYINMCGGNEAKELFLDLEKGQDLSITVCQDSISKHTKVEKKVSTVRRIHHEDTYYAIIKVAGFIDLYTDEGTIQLDGFLLVSNKSGFIGSYLKDASRPNQIIQKEGNILEGPIDYSEMSFRRIR